MKSKVKVKKSYRVKSRYDILLNKPGKIVRSSPNFINIVWAEDLNNEDIENLREQVQHALTDPNYSIISNYEIHWERIPVDRNSISRLVWANDIDAREAEELSNLVEAALTDPDFVIVTNYEVHWNEIK
jgi:hypothetical protein